MTQTSRPQADNTANGFTDSGPYSRDQWAFRVRAAHTGDTNTAFARSRIRGVVPTYDHLLVVSVDGDEITVGTGAGLVYGSYLFNDAAVLFAPPATGANTRIDVVCLVENNTNAAVATDSVPNTWRWPTVLADYDGNAVPAYSARLVIISGAEAAIPVAPVLDQTNTLYCVPLAQYTIDNTSTITALTDLREFADIERIVGVAVADNATIKDAAILGTQVTDGAGAAGLGVGIRARLENAIGTLKNAARLVFRWTDAADGSEDSRAELYLSAGNADNLSAVINAPTAASVNGNARGAGAVDLQPVRSAATQVASGVGAFIAGGIDNTASGNYSHAEGNTATASGRSAHAEGEFATASGNMSHAEGELTNATAESAHAEGQNTLASGLYSHAEGIDTVASGAGSHSEGGTNTASAGFSHAEGNGTTASGLYSHAEGLDTVASGAGSHSEGGVNTASAGFSHAEGNGTTANGLYSHAEGKDTAASGIAAHAEGQDTVAQGNYSHAAGRRAKTGANNGVFIWGDSENADVTADRADQFKVRASGGTYLLQNNNAAALPVLQLNQTDQDETFIDFIGTTAADQTKSISTVNGDGVVTGPKNFSASAGWEFVGMVKIDVNGAPFWMPYYQPDKA